MRVVIAGCSGRMGKVLLQHALNEHENGRCVLVGGTVHPDSEYIGKDLNAIVGAEGKSGIKAYGDLTHLANITDAVIDFTTPSYTVSISKICGQYGVAHICGTTGLSATEKFHLERNAFKTPTFYSANMSIGVNLLVKLSQEAARFLGAKDYDINISEMHHNKKVDSPSGTALMLADAISNALDTPQQVPIVAIRAGGVPGIHDVIFASDGEVVTLQHNALNRSIYASGAFKACYWMHGQLPEKLYSMQDVIGVDVEVLKHSQSEHDRSL